MQKKILPIALLGIGIAVSIIVLPKTKVLFETPGSLSSATTEVLPQPIEAVGFEYGDLIRTHLSQNQSLSIQTVPQIGITSHHLPTAVSFISDFYNTLKQKGTSPKTFVIIGPDHYEYCKKFVSTTRRSYRTPFGILETNAEIINDLQQNKLVAEVDSCFDGEHSIGVQAMFVKFLYPNATIVPLIYSSAASDEVVDKVAQILDKYKTDITVIVSVDFSHYQSTSRANQSDQEAVKMIEDLDGRGLTLRHLDSPASIKTAIALSKLWNLKAYVLKHNNSYDFTGESENTTGYFNIMFGP